MLQALGMIFAAQIVAPFTAPPSISMPSNIPRIPSGVYRKASWMDYPGKATNFHIDRYITTPRRRGSVVSIVTIQRTIRRETQGRNRYTKGQAIGNFWPQYDVAINRYDCQNDTWSIEYVLSITDASDGSTGFMHPIDFNETKWRVTRGQTKVMIEGRPYWAMPPELDPRHEKKPLEWKHTRPGTMGADEIDHVCTNF